jgi:prophage maintenance system killer protein
MKSLTFFSDQLIYTLRELYTIQKSIFYDEDILSLINKESIDRCFLATKTKHKSGIRLSRSILEKSAVLLYELVKQNSSQRKSKLVACIACMLFLYQNGYWLVLPARDFKSLLIWIESTHPLNEKETITGIRNVLKTHVHIIDTI